MSWEAESTCSRLGLVQDDVHSERWSRCLARPGLPTFPFFRRPVALVPKLLSLWLLCHVRPRLGHARMSPGVSALARAPGAA